MAKQHLQAAEYYNNHICPLPPLSIGDSVLLQNQTGNHTTCWKETGRIVETLPNKQYNIKVGGSNRVTLCNECFLCKIHPVALPAQPANISVIHYVSSPYLPSSPVVGMPLEPDVQLPDTIPSLPTHGPVQVPMGAKPDIAGPPFIAQQRGL